MQKCVKISLFIGAIALFAASSAGLSSCYYDDEETLYGSTGTTCTDSITTVSYAATIGPMMANSCAFSGCHSGTFAASGINLDGHTNLKNYITNSQAAFLGSIEHTGGYSPMPKGGGKLAACDIAKLKAWITAGMLNN